MENTYNTTMGDVYSHILRALSEKGTCTYRQLKDAVASFGNVSPDFDFFFGYALEHLGYAHLIVYMGCLYEMKSNSFELTTDGRKELESGSDVTRERLLCLQPLLPAIVRGDAQVDWKKCS